MLPCCFTQQLICCSFTDLLQTRDLLFRFCELETDLDVVPQVPQPVRQVSLLQAALQRLADALADALQTWKSSSNRLLQVSCQTSSIATQQQLQRQLGQHLNASYDIFSAIQQSAVSALQRVMT